MSKTVVVTGASRGLGLAITKQLLRDGFTVAAVSRTMGHLSEIGVPLGESLLWYQCDLGDSVAVRNVCQKICSDRGRVFGLVNNAAIGVDGVLATMHDSDIRRLIAVNLESPILMSKWLVRGMVAGKEGRICNISSVIAMTGYSGLSVYAATKAGLVGFTRSLAREVGRAGVCVNVVCPGFMETDMTSGLEGGKLESIRRRSPLGRLVDVGSVAAVVGMLMSDAGKDITGSSFVVDAGNTA